MTHTAIIVVRSRLAVVQVSETLARFGTGTPKAIKFKGA